MAIQPTLTPDDETKTETAASQAAVPADGLTPPGVAAAAFQGEAPAVVPVEGQMRELRILDADTAVAVDPDGGIPAEFSPADTVVIDAMPLLPEVVSVDDVLAFVNNAVAAAHSHAAPPPLSGPGEVIDLLSGTEALAAIDALAPFELPDGSEDESLHFPPAGAAAAPAFALNAAPDSPAGELIFLDFTSFAKPDNPGGGGGGGNGGGKGGKNGGDDTVPADPGDPAVLTEYLSGDPGGYNILIEFDGSWTPELQDAFIWSADWISGIILGDVQDVFYRGDIIDDILISATLTYIDGEGFILGQAGPTAIRTDGYLPAVGIMEFDSADAQDYYAQDLWDDIVLHEMLHTIGFGTVWDFLGLVDGSGSDSPTFTGLEASLAYADLLQSDDPVAVPLEQDGGPGTVESHWDEETFDNEIMTGYIDGSNDMSILTVASLSDLGYDTVSWSSFAEFTV